MLQVIADILEIMGENPFRIRAYKRAAQDIEAFIGTLAANLQEKLKNMLSQAVSGYTKS